MKDIIGTMVKRRATEQLVGDYYQQFFERFNSNELFEVYDISREKFISFPGREGSHVVNRNTLVKNLADMEANHGRIEEILVIHYDNNDVSFNEPVFVGSEDSFYARER